MIKERSAGAIIFRQAKERKYLLLQYGYGHWEFVRGNIEDNESEIETIRREAKEEAGLNNLEFVPNFKERINFFYKKDQELVSKEVIFYLAETKQEEIKLSIEHKGYKWLNFNDALSQLTYDNAKGVLKKAEEFLEKYNSQRKLDKY